MFFQVFTISEWYHFLCDLLSTWRDDKLLVIEWMLIFSVLKRSGTFHLVFHIDLSYVHKYLQSLVCNLSILCLSKNVKYLTKYWYFSTWYSNAFLRKMTRRINISKKNMQFYLKKVHLHFLGSSLHLWKKRRKIDAIISINFSLYNFFYLLSNSGYNPSQLRDSPYTFITCTRK